ADHAGEEDPLLLFCEIVRAVRHGASQPPGAIRFDGRLGSRIGTLTGHPEDLGADPKKSTGMRGDRFEVWGAAFEVAGSGQPAPSEDGTERCQFPADPRAQG
ncbi:MAG: hypothetical protein P4L20_11240, partial [Acidimicrobiales bacterium]|nr:hypothetical protein [Acidimicrobiales bacterium]